MTKPVLAPSTFDSIPKQKLNLDCDCDIRVSSEQVRWVNLDVVALAGVDVTHDLTKFP